MSLTQLTERVAIWEGGVNFGIIKGANRRLILVDSGLDSSAPRKALKPFFEEGWQLGTIINTHSHADHIGGNSDLVRRTGCKVMAPAKERPFILWPELEPLGLNGGAWPPPALQVKFLQAQPTPSVDELPTAPSRVTVEGVELELIATPGHAWDQVAIGVDGVLLAADSLFKPEVLAKHPVTFLVNVANYEESLRSIGARPERYILPGHGALIDRAVEEGDPLPAIIDANLASLAAIQAAIMAAAVHPITGEQLLHEVTAALGKVHDSEPQYCLDRAAISAHLTHLITHGRVAIRFDNGVRLVCCE